MQVPYDKTGAEIKEGDFIVYGHALGRCAGLRIGKVLAIKHHADKAYTWSADWSISVIGVDDDWDSCAPRLCASKGTLAFPDRIVVLRRENVPATHLVLLDPITQDTKLSRK